MWHLFSKRSTRSPEAERRFKEIERLLLDVERDTEPVMIGDERDRIAIDYEDAFAGQYGFRWPRAARIALVDLKNELQLTRRDIKWLYFGGNLLRDDGVKILGDPRVAAAGSILIGILSLVVGMGMWIAVQQLSTHPMHALQNTLLVSLLVGLCALAYVVCIFPERISRLLRAS